MYRITRWTQFSVVWHKITACWSHVVQCPVKPLCCVMLLHFPWCISAWPLCWMTAIRRRNTDRRSDERAMAATGGGKIRSRRYHIASKPYAKSKQVNRVKVFALKALVGYIPVTAVPLSFSRCYCFVGDISRPAVSARGLHALLACLVNASELACWLTG